MYPSNAEYFYFGARFRNSTFSRVPGRPRLILDTLGHFQRIQSSIPPGGYRVSAISDERFGPKEDMKKEDLISLQRVPLSILEGM